VPSHDDGHVLPEGGEEFSIILAELEMNIALKVTERIRKVVERHPFSIKGRSPTRP